MSDQHYVYIGPTRDEPLLRTVGFYRPDGKWEPESDHETDESAAVRVAYLNGGPTPQTAALASLREQLAEAQRELDIVRGRPFGIGPDGEPDAPDIGAWRDATKRAESAEREVAALKAQGACAGWRPIETAPKDGTRIVGYAPRVYGHAYWACLRWQSFSDGSAGWVGGSFASDPDGAFSAFVTPTHWLPLPVAPVAPTPEG